MNDKITAFCQINTPPKHHIKHYEQQKRTLKNCYASKYSKTTIILQSISIFLKFVDLCLPLCLP